MFDGIGAELVWDGSEYVRVPARLGTPRPDQMIGTTAEKLTELGGRVCYDSLNAEKSRNSDEYLRHILQVGHFSVAEHFNATVVVQSHRDTLIDTLSFVMLNRPGIWVTPVSPTCVRITANCRAVMEFNERTRLLLGLIDSYPVHSAMHIGTMLMDCFHPLAPRIVKQPHPAGVQIAAESLGISLTDVVEPESDAEKWISLLVYGSRGMSHELVRHGDYTGISQRSSRFCDESDSPWSIHPLIQAFIRDSDKDQASALGIELAAFSERAKDLYRSWVTRLTPFVKNTIPDSDPHRATTARKQARGAARGLLGNALETELIFSASVLEWRHIFKMRAAQAADGEIRFAMSKALGACKASRYGDRFSDLTLVPAIDGIGEMLDGGGAA